MLTDRSPRPSRCTPCHMSDHARCNQGDCECLCHPTDPMSRYAFAVREVIDAARGLFTDEVYADLVSTLDRLTWPLPRRLSVDVPGPRVEMETTERSETT